MDLNFGGDTKAKPATPDMASDIGSVLLRRGVIPVGKGSTLNTLYPEELGVRMLEVHGVPKFLEYFPNQDVLGQYLNYFGQNKFRKLVRRLLRNGREWVPVEEFIGSRATEYLAFLERLLILERKGNTVRLIRDINDLDFSLEHYVAQICIRELRGSAEWGVHISNLPRTDSGGDFDVLAWLDPSLIYVECKTSAPGSIGESALREFLQRSFELAPDLAILLIDTEDDLTPFVNEKINPIIRDEMGFKDETYQPITEEPTYPRVFFGVRHIYVLNARKTILSQLQRCLQLYYAHTKHASFFGGPPTLVNFTKERIRDEE